MRRARGLAAPTLAFALLAGAAGPCPATPAPADSSQAGVSLLGLDDLGLALFTGVGLAVLGHVDRDLSERWSATASGDGLARFGERFGNPLYSLPLLGAAYVAGRVAHRPGLSASALRIGGGMVTAGVLAGGAKLVAGRWRPYESSSDAGRFSPFSSHSSFPSGHATIAFSLAAGLDRETRTAWVPLVAYPAAAITAWSRVHERKHWPTDVAAGALLGVWASGRFDRIVRTRGANRVSLRVSPVVDPATGSLDLGATLRF
ncbi:MAG: phosphatase PAP2 family protein [Candidatus Eisenbacteria bacterium]